MTPNFGYPDFSSTLDRKHEDVTVRFFFFATNMLYILSLNFTISESKQTFPIWFPVFLPLKSLIGFGLKSCSCGLKTWVFQLPSWFSKTLDEAYHVYLDLSRFDQHLHQ